MVAEWELPGESQLASGLHFDLDELLLLDWILTPCSNIYPQATLDTAMAWQTLRLSLWDCIAIWDRTPRPVDLTMGIPKPIPPLGITLAEAAILLTICPVEFRWGSGENCGSSLKLKLRAYLRGEPEEDTDAHNGTATSPTQADG